LPKRPDGFIFFSSLSASRPAAKKAVWLFDGQNLFRHAKDAFGYHHPNDDPAKLAKAKAACSSKGSSVAGVQFCTCVPELEHSAMWHHDWTRRLTVMHRAAISVTSRRLRHRLETINLDDGTEKQVNVLREKGIGDLALIWNAWPVMVIRMLRSSFSQDQDFAGVAREVRDMPRSQERWLNIVSAFPESSTATASKGISYTDWFCMDKAFHDACIDPGDQRPPR